MKVKRFAFAAHALLASGVLCGAAAAQAADWYNVKGYAVTTSQEALIHPGMTTAEVQQALGRPEQIEKFRSEPGPTWTYRVKDTVFSRTVCDVQFGPDGRVVSVSEDRKDGGGGDI